MEPILTSLVTGVGTAIAKGSLKRWLKDHPEALGATGAVIDILGKVAKDLIDSRRGARQFDDIAEKVAEDAFVVVEATGIELTPTQKTVVVDVAGEVLNRCVDDPEFGAALLAKHSLEPGQLSQWFQQHTTPPVPEGSNPADDPTRGFNDRQRTLYERLLFDAAQYIVDLGSQFPSFTEKTFSEVLKRPDQLSGKADAIVDEVRRIRQALLGDEATEAAFEEKYRRAVIRRLDQLQLFGVDVANTSKRYRLSVAYVTLRVERPRASVSATAPFFTVWAPSQGRDAHDEGEYLDDSETVPVDKALASAARLFVRGPAGSGKTTLLQWVAMMTAARNLTGDLSQWNDHVPFFIKLREFADKELPIHSHLPLLIDRQTLADDLPGGWATRKLESGRALVLIDGLDEMPQARREYVRQWINSLVDEYPNSRFVVTSRPYAAEEGWLYAEAFMDAELQDMTTPDVHAFINHWHAAVKEGVQTADEKDELDELGTALLITVKANEAIHRLATSPLLCAILCALHRDRVKNLPGDRIELYRACIEMFFRRDTERKVKLVDYIDLSDRQKRTVLGDLAFWLIRNNFTMASEADADERLEKSLRSIGKRASGISGSDARKLFVERSGILRQPEPEKIDFPHRTFQEYFAAHAAIGESCIGELIENAHRDQWREVLVLAAGVATESDAEKLVQGILERGDKSRKNKAGLYLLAVACSELVVRFPEGSADGQTVTDRLERILPPKTIREAKELASAGDLVVPFLGYNSKWKKPELAASVRTLAHVGTEEACAAIATYRQSDSKAVWKQIFASTDYMPEPDRLRTAIESDATPIRLRSLNLGHLKVNGLWILAGLTSLRHLDLSYAQAVDILELTGLTNLLTLDLAGTSISDVSALAGLTNLQSLNLAETEVSDVSALASLTKLRTLGLAGTPVCDLTALADLINLKSLDVAETQVIDVSALTGLARLRTLDLTGTQTSDLTSLADLISLESLHLAKTQVNDVSDLAGLSNLRRLDLWGTRVSGRQRNRLRKVLPNCVIDEPSPF